MPLYDLDKAEVFARLYLSWFNRYFNVINEPFILTKISNATHPTFVTDLKSGLDTTNLNRDLENHIKTFTPEFERLFGEEFAMLCGNMQSNEHKYARLDEQYTANQIEFQRNCEIAITDPDANYSALERMNRRLCRENEDIWMAGEAIKAEQAKLLTLFPKYEWIAENIRKIHVRLYYNKQPKNKKLVIELI